MTKWRDASQEDKGYPVKPVLLDLFCGAGGATKGYQDVGFFVIGVDLEKQPHYVGDRFRQGEWETWLYDLVMTWPIDAIHASPPCQAYTDLQKRHQDRTYPDLVAPVRDALASTGKPYVIENVEGSPLRKPITLCGTQFKGLRVIRHRLFETNWGLRGLPVHPKHPLTFTWDKRKAHYGKLDQDKSFVQVYGGGSCTVPNARDAMGIPWMSKKELNNAIPPAYTRYIGQQLKEAL